MTKHIVVILKRVQKQLDKFSDIIAYPIFDAIKNLQNNPRLMGYKKLKGSDGYLMRVGESPIIYE